MPIPRLKIDEAADSARRWAKAMKARAQRKPFPNRALSPWEENTWFEVPIENSFTGDNTTNAFKIVNYNPRRVALTFSNRGPQTMLVSTSNSGTTQGFILNPTVNPFPILQKDFGNLVQVEWFAYGLGVGAWGMTVLEVILREWPGG